MNNKSFLFIGIAIFAVIFFFSSFFTVRETETAMVIRLGSLRPGADKVGLAPGLHLKLPFVETVQYIDKRLQTLEFSKARIVTAEKKDVLVDSFIKWKVQDPELFFTSTGANKIQAEQLLRQKVYDALRGEFGRHTIKELVSGERLQVMETIRDKSNATAKTLGVAVVDARVKAIDLPTEVSEAVFERMRTERERVATEHRAQGKEKAEGMRADADATVTIILATAEAESQRIRGEGDAIASKMYSDAFSKDQDFFIFMKSMESYKEAFKNNNNLLVLQPNSPFFNFFKQLQAPMK